MRIFGRQAALSSAASFSGIGSPPAIAKDGGKKADDDMKKEGDETTKDDTNAAAAPPAAETPDKGDDDADDDDEEGDDESDGEELKGKKGKKVQAARGRERSRIATIMAHPKAAAHADFALKMALTSSLGRAAICGMLDALPAAAAANTLAARMAAEANRHAGPAPAAPSAAAHAAQIEAGWEKAIGRARDPFAL